LWPGLQGQRQAGSLTVTHKAKKGAAAVPAGPPLPERAAANCLCCGKIYLTREGSKDVARFLGAAPPPPPPPAQHASHAVPRPAPRPLPAAVEA